MSDGPQNEVAIAREATPSWQIGHQPTQGGLRAVSGFVNSRLGSFRSRFCLDEASGALGDLGTLIPLLAASASEGSIRLGPALLWMGAFNVVTAVQWDVPMPVQPMKSIVAVAISDGMTPGAMAAAGIITGGVVWLLGLTRLVDFVNLLIPTCVIAGMQIGLGVKMAGKGCSYWSINGWLFDEDNNLTTDNKLTALLSLVFTTFLLLRTRLPAALIIFSLGIVLSIPTMVNDGTRVKFEMLDIPLVVPSSADWVDGLIHGAIPQIPLTTLNSVVSVCALSTRLFRDPAEGGKGISRTSVATSVGIMNVIGCWFGGMPSCHGAGGLAGQFKFGARGGCSLLMLGFSKIALAVALGQGVDSVIASYPKVVLGVLLLFAGVELASVGVQSIADSGDLDSELLSCFVTAGAYIGTKNMALGVAGGLIVTALQSLERWRDFVASARTSYLNTGGREVTVCDAARQSELHLSSRGCG